MTILAVLLSMLALGAAGFSAVLWQRLHQAQAAHDASVAELGQMKESQSQVIHTTKLASLGQMIAGIAHEMNTPIGFVKSNAEVVRELLAEHREMIERWMVMVDKIRLADLSRPGATDIVKKALTHIHSEQQKHMQLTEADELLADAHDGLVQLANLVRNLKGFARVDRDGMDLHDLNESIESALTIAQHQLRDRITVVKELQEIPRVKAMPSQINQVLLNLINNASQAMGEAGTMTIRSRRSGDHVEVDVLDTGPGIPPEVLPKIFDPFFTTKPVGEGTGLGLAIVHKIVHAHGGAVVVDSKPGVGTRFTVSMPIDFGSMRQQGVAKADLVVSNEAEAT